MRMTKVTLVSEAQKLREAGLTVDQVRVLYDAITDAFVAWCERPDVTEFRAELARPRKHERRLWHDLIDGGCEYFARLQPAAKLPPVELDWRSVKFEPERVKRCEVCQSWFYDIARNGRTLTCSRRGIYKRWDMTNRKFVYYVKNGARLSECAAEYELRRYDGGSRSVAKSNEILNDFQPAEDDEKAINFLNYVELSGQKLL